jgi:GNAT superfamily N-acetyltransferase
MRALPVNVMMRRPTLDGVPAKPILAAPLLVRRAHVQEAGALAALLGRAFETETWDAAGTERELFCDETVRATLVVAAEGRLMATASLQVRPDVPVCGWVRWVATDRDRRRQGLGRALGIGVLTAARQAGCREARLRTHTDPLAAIPLYVQLGFEPRVTGEAEREVWERVSRRLSGEAGGGRALPPKEVSMNKSELLSGVREEYRQWEALLNQIGEARMEQPGAAADWSIKDIIAHLTGWRRRTVARLQAAQRSEGEPPSPWPAHLQADVDLDAINAWIYEQNRGRSLREVLDESHHVFQQMFAAIEGLPDEVLSNPARYLPWLEAESIKPSDFFGHFHEEHESDMRAWLARVEKQ